MDRTVGLLMDFFQPAVVAGVGACLKERGYRLDARWSIRADWAEDPSSWEGLIVQEISPAPHWNLVKSLALPLVYLSTHEPRPASVQVENDGRKAVRLALEEFAGLDIQRLVSLPFGRSHFDRNCRRSLQVDARDMGFELHQIGNLPGKSWARQLDHLAEEISRVPAPAGLFYPHSGLLFSLMDHLREQGVRVPEDLAVITFEKDAQKTAEWCVPSLTGVIPDLWMKGFEAARLLVEMLEGRPPKPGIRRIPPLGLNRRESTGMSVSKNSVVARTLHNISTLPLEIVSVAELVRLAGVSRRTLEMRFREETGKSLHEQLMARRIEHARLLLRFKGEKLETVATHCGFSSLAYFSAAFKRECGLSPRAFRDRFR